MIHLQFFYGEDLTKAFIVLGCIIINDGIQPNILVQCRSAYIQILCSIGLTGQSVHQIFVVTVEEIGDIVIVSADDIEKGK